ncbi:hypothetical protein FJQ98_23515 [Lysinibacillus agricola]|uniref:Uncharacterized protein n=1 Tax=Lysinibacillus agricola TaxID=2590012 RepID=A0ABX7AS73_9BACI|nr:MULTISPECIES: hypothetical protein [Lysinibacillus]KOS62282.1 hypothetical protein AN161_13270 [Lysinibacillus sp. FJAT-14222]QQP12050.1 hypothetical protein FJQ98_23515 [Lysinibacillus agricola]
MRLFYQQKIIGKKSRKLQKIPFAIEEPVHTLKDLLMQLVTQEVHNYNEKAMDTPLHMYITDQQLEDAAQHGKVHFGEKKSPSVQSVDQAISTVLQAFEDELFLVLQNEEQLNSLIAPLAIREDDVFTFIKLTMLAGRI